MRILHVITRSDLGGAQTVVLTLANTMCTEHEVIVAGGGNGSMWSLLDPRITQIHIPEIVREISPRKDIKAWFKLRKLYKQYQPDVIHLHSSKIGALGRLAFPKNRTVYSVHGFDSIRLAYRKFLLIEKLLKNRCKAIVLASDYDKRNMEAEGITKHLHIVYNGLKEPTIDPHLHLPQVTGYDKIVLCIARVSPQKRFASFVTIAQRLPQYAFVWIGADADKHDETIPNLWILAGIPNADRYIQTADLFLLPSNYEGVPITIIDALSYGKPVISSDVGGISEIVHNNINGFTLPNDDDIFVEKISYILDNPEIATSFGEQSKQIYNQQLTIQAMVTGYTKIYQL